MTSPKPAQAGAHLAVAGNGAQPHDEATAWCHLPEPAGRWQLWPQQAAFDPERGLLLVADAHLGKAVSFRRLGVPVPAATPDEALARLDALVAATGARQARPAGR